MAPENQTKSKANVCKWSIQSHILSQVMTSDSITHLNTQNRSGGL